MKTKSIHKGFFLICSLISFEVFGQINPSTNNQIDLRNSHNEIFEQNDVGKFRDRPSLESADNVFWAINDVGVITRFCVDGDSISSCGNTIFWQGSGIAICENLNGGSINPTFYATGWSNSIYFYDGSQNWIRVEEEAPQSIYNPGGNGQYLYFQAGGYNGASGKIYKYNESTFDTFFSWDNLGFAAAGTAVDDDGSVYCVLDSVGSTSTYSKYIDVLDSSGKLKARFDFIFDTQNCFGTFILNDTLYLGIGWSNPVYPNSLVPIHFTQDSAYALPPIPIPEDNWNDLAVCQNCITLAINKKEISLTSDFNLYPNPVTEKLNISMENTLSLQDGYISIYNMQGQLVWEMSVQEEIIEIDISSFAQGPYLVRMSSKDKIEVRKIFKN